MHTIRRGRLAARSGMLAEGTYTFAVDHKEPGYVLALADADRRVNNNPRDEGIRFNEIGPRQYADFQWARALGYTHGWLVSPALVTWLEGASGQPLAPHIDPPVQYHRLRLVSIDDGYNEHEDMDTLEVVYLQHVTARRLFDFDEIDIQDEWADYRGALTPQGPVFADFKEWLAARLIDPDRVDELRACHLGCGPGHVDDMHQIHGGDYVCDDCNEDYRDCDDCGRRMHSDDMYYTAREDMVCQRCRESSYYWCDNCDTYYHHEAPCHHDDGDGDGCCESPAKSFTLRNDGLDPLANDTRVTITLGAGEISDEGILQIRRAMSSYAHAHEYNSDRCEYVYTNVPDMAERERWSRLIGDVDEVLGNKWQTKEGNYTKRLSRHAYKNHQIKVPPAVVSEVGNIASAHSVAVDHRLEVTRDLNLSASEFAHEESCWWGSYYHGRCALKSNGGFGIRTFEDNGWVQGRAWVIPLRWTGEEGVVRNPGACNDPECCTQPTGEPAFVPTFDTMRAHAFMVFNGYGNLSGYAPARILAHMAGMTYRKVTFTRSMDNGEMYVNGDAGYLVAAEELAEKYTDGRIHMSFAQHADLYETERADAARFHAAMESTAAKIKELTNA